MVSMRQKNCIHMFSMRCAAYIGIGSKRLKTTLVNKTKEFTTDYNQVPFPEDLHWKSLCLELSLLQRPVLHLNVSTLQKQVLHIDVSRLQRPVLHLDVSTLQRSVLHLDISTPVLLLKVSTL
jgi:hypothetical protein